LFAVFTDTFLITGTRISGCVFKQNDTIDTQIKNTEIMPTTWKKLKLKLMDVNGSVNGHKISDIKP
jgi:hypothetical protein